MTTERPFVGIVGLGMVGKPHLRWFTEVKGYARGVDLFCLDSDPTLGYFDDIAKAKIVFVCVPTPPLANGECDTSIVSSVLNKLRADAIVVLRSTVTPGTTDGLQTSHPQKALMFCPERLTEKRAWEDFINPDCFIIGTTRQSRQYAREVQLLMPEAGYMRPDREIYSQEHMVTALEAECMKYAWNNFGALKVSFANGIADLACALSYITRRRADASVILEALGADRRIRPSWLDVHHGNYAGFGGYCFPKDAAAFVMFIRRAAREARELAGKDAPWREQFDALEAYGDLLEAMYRYNQKLLAAQGLTVADVSVHNPDLKARPIRSYAHERWESERRWGNER